MAKEFIYEDKITSEYLDIYGHVNNAKYLVLYEKARWAMFKPFGITTETVKDQAEGPIITELTLKFRRELKEGDEIKIFTKFIGLKNSLIFNVEQRIQIGEKQIASEAKYDFAIMDMNKRKLKKVDDKWLSLFGQD